MCVYSLLCLREGEAEGEGTEVRGAGTGHLRTGSSKTLLLSMLSVMYSTDTGRQGGRRGEKRRERAARRREEGFRGERDGGERGGDISEAFDGIDATGLSSAW